MYDIENYEHPGRKRTISLSIGKPLEEFFNIPEYSFHKTSAAVTKDLEKICVGELQTICNTTAKYNK